MIQVMVGIGAEQQSLALKDANQSQYTLIYAGVWGFVWKSVVIITVRADSNLTCFCSTVDIIYWCLISMCFHVKASRS